MAIIPELSDDECDDPDIDFELIGKFTPKAYDVYKPITIATLPKTDPNIDLFEGSSPWY